MKKATKCVLIIAAILLAVGLCVSLIALIAVGFDFGKLGNGQYTETTYEAQDAFRNITIEGGMADIAFYPENDGSCRMICKENDTLNYLVEVKDGTLRIVQQDARKWYQFLGFFTQTPTLNVYLPEEIYGDLSVSSRSGRIEIPSGFTFASASLECQSGSIGMQAAVNGVLRLRAGSGSIRLSDCAPASLDISTQSGGIRLKNLRIGGAAELNATSGSIRLESVTCSRLDAKASSGRIALSDVTADGEIRTEVSSGNTEFRNTVAGALNATAQSGNITLEKSDAGELTLKASSGNITGNVLTEKIFLAESSSGRVNVPRSFSGGRCEITTGSGNIDLRISTAD